MPIGERIQISWSQFELEETTNCRLDFVEVFSMPASPTDKHITL